MVIYQLEKGETADYASSELAKYIEIMCGEIAVIKCEKCDESGIVLGTLDKLELSVDGIENSQYDDAYDINIKGFDGYISGSNVRSILYGVYAYLHEVGCRFFRPGEGGEYIPEKDLSVAEVKLTKVADLRYRADCIEGSLSFETIEERLKWLPKVGYNGYMIQGVTPTNMLNRWYSHLGNPHKEAKPLTLDQQMEITKKAEKAIKNVVCCSMMWDMTICFLPMEYSGIPKLLS